VPTSSSEDTVNAGNSDTWQWSTLKTNGRDGPGLGHGDVLLEHRTTVAVGNDESVHGAGALVATRD
jgi:hypothetical protein